MAQSDYWPNGKPKATHYRNGKPKPESQIAYEHRVKESNERLANDPLMQGIVSLTPLGTMKAASNIVDDVSAGKKPSWSDVGDAALGVIPGGAFTKAGQKVGKGAWDAFNKIPVDPNTLGSSPFHHLFKGVPARKAPKDADIQKVIDDNNLDVSVSDVKNSIWQGKGPAGSKAEQDLIKSGGGEANLHDATLVQNFPKLDKDNFTSTRVRDASIWPADKGMQKFDYGEYVDPMGKTRGFNFGEGTGSVVSQVTGRPLRNKVTGKMEPGSPRNYDVHQGATTNPTTIQQRLNRQKGVPPKLQFDPKNTTSDELMQHVKAFKDRGLTAEQFAQKNRISLDQAKQLYNMFNYGGRVGPLSRR